MTAPTELLRPIIGIENRTAQEVFDIMCDRFCALPTSEADWRDMESAPKDGRQILLHGLVQLPSVDAGKESTVVAYWADINGGGWVWYGALSTVWTHWMPLPSAPDRRAGE